MKKETKTDLFFIVIIIILFLLLLKLGFFNMELNEIKEFCSKKCLGIDKVISYEKNDTFKFIKCECNVKIINPMGFEQTWSYESEIKYFDFSGREINIEI